MDQEGAEETDEGGDQGRTLGWPPHRQNYEEELSLENIITIPQNMVIHVVFSSSNLLETQGLMLLKQAFLTKLS